MNIIAVGKWKYFTKNIYNIMLIYTENYFEPALSPRTLPDRYSISKHMNMHTYNLTES